MRPTVVHLFSMIRHTLRLLTACVLLGGYVHAQTPVATDPIEAQSVAANGSPVEIALDQHFTIEGVGNFMVRFDTVVGDFDVELLPAFAPNHVTNFRAYVNRGDYDNTVIHRMAAFATEAVAIVQGGGYTAAVPLGVVPVAGQVALEYNHPNARGTLAAARTSNPNSAGAGWYFNTIDNSVTLGPTNDGFGYTVFGRVMSDGMTVVDAMAAINRFVVSADLQDFPLRNYTAGEQIAVENYLTLNRVFEIPMYPETNDSEAALAFTATSSHPGIVGATLAGSTLRLNPLNVGTATITVRASDISGLVAVQEFTVAVGGIEIEGQPASVDVAPGAPTHLAITASAETTLSYQWYRQRTGEPTPTALPGATSNSMQIATTRAADMGFYWVKITAGELEATSDIAVVTLSGGQSRLANLSTRGRIGAGGALTPGFVVKGTGDKSLVVRAVGPQLLNFGVQSALVDPRMSIIPANGSEAVVANDNWGDAANAAELETASAAVGAFALDASSQDAALLTSLPLPSATGTQGYTVRIQSTDAAAAGIALAEVYDPDGIDGAIQLTNVSALGFSGTGEDVLSPGFVIDGAGAKTMLIRVVGPSLEAYGVTGVMADPRLSLIPAGQTAAIATNDNWGGTAALKAAFAVTGAFAFDSDASLDAAVLVRLPPGAYTVKPEGFGGSTGTILVEAYAVEE